MKPESWQQLDNLFHSALERVPEGRAAFLDGACAGDDQLRKQVEALLAAHEKAGSFIEGSAMEVEARRVAADPEDRAAEFANGKAVSHYRIISPLGSGGMGDVYLAQDTVLNRQVALKLLPEYFTRDTDRLRRFQQEARAASALNHPNIITIYEIGQVDDRHFIATEFIDGETLRQKFFGQGTNTSGKQLRLRQVLDIAIQTADALAAAHEAGIVHRDIKPENLMVRRRDSYMKVLDFGLAKLTEDAVDSESPTRAQVNTRAGIVMGTPSYMSPEQARGEQVDARTDIWSLGVVLYELVAGCVPFERSTPSEVIALILERAPPPLARYAREVPTELERIVSKALTKDREERYQTAKDVLIDLRRLRQQLEVKAEVDRLATPGPGSELAPTPDAKQKAVGTTDGLTARAQAELVRPASSAEYLVTGIQNHKRTFALIASVVLTASLVIAGVLIYNHRSQPLTEKDTILIADFVNKTGEEVFDGALKQGLAVQLEQSPFLNIFSDERIQQTLRLMGRPDQHVTRDVAREICERQGLKAMIVGSIALLGSRYVIALEVVNARSGDSLAHEQVVAESKDQVLNVLSKAATGLREKLGESLSTIQKFDVPLEATTSSLEALKDYSQATVLNAKGKRPEAITLLQRAVELDPQFASGYSSLSIFSHNIGEREAARAYGTRAFELRERASEPERLDIIARYYTLVTGELEQGIETLELLKQIYPRRLYVRNGLTYSFSLLGQHEKALEEMQEEVRLDPNNPQFYRNLARQLRYLKRFQEARAVLERASAQKLDAPALRLESCVNAFLQGDAAEMQSQMEWFRARPDEPSSFGLQTAVAEVSGQYRKARDFRAEWVERTQLLKHKEAAASIAAGDAQTDALSGHCELVQQEADRSLAIARSPSALQTVSLALALCGELGQAQSLADEYARLMPTDTLAIGVDLPVIRAAIANHRENYAQAIELLRTARRYEHAEFFKIPLDLDQFAPYLRGQAFLGQRSGAEASAEFQYVLDHRSLAPFSLLGPLAQLGLARAHALNGDIEKAHKAYDDFFALWKDADADLPVLIEAKKEYEKLK